VTPSLIAARHSSENTQAISLPASHGWFDPQGVAGAQYELQAIDRTATWQTFTPLYAAKSGSHVIRNKSER